MDEVFTDVIKSVLEGSEVEGERRNGLPVCCLQHVQHLLYVEVVL